MRRSLRALLALGVVALVGAGCSGSSTDAATVNGTSVSRGELLDQARAFAELPDDPLGLAPRVENGRVIAYDAGGMAGLLTQKITEVLVRDAARRHGIEVSDQDRAQVRSQGLGPYEALPEQRLDSLVDRVALQNKLFEYITENRWWSEQDVSRYYELVKDTTFTQACTSHILVEDRAEAEEVLDRLDAGASFEDLAAEWSTDAASADEGGELGCAGRGELVAPYEQAVDAGEDGEVVGPVETRFGFHVIRIDSAFEPLPLDDGVRAEIEESFSDPQASGWADYQLRTAEVSVDPRFGHWSAEGFRVVPPESPAGARGDIDPLP